jgi:hypothetical protein
VNSLRAVSASSKHLFISLGANRLPNWALS